MSDKKHIDRLFQEKLKDFEAIPSEGVWDNINAKLKESRKRRIIIPLWWKVAGIAAGIVLLFTIGNLIVNDNNSKSIPDNVVNTESDTNAGTKEDNANSSNDLNNIDQDQIATENNSGDQISNEEQNVINPNLDNLISNKENATEPNNVVSGTDSNTITNQKLKKEARPENNKAYQNAISQNKQNEEFKDGTIENATIDKQKSDAVINETKKEVESKLADSNSDKDDVTDVTNGDPNKEDVQEDTEKLSITEEIEKNEETVADVEEDVNEKRWSIAPNIAPVYFNSLGAGSSIDDQFVNNSKTGEINMSYGLGASYDLNTKLTVRAGINQLRVGYSTNDVIVYNNLEPTIEEKPLKNVDLNSNGQDLSFLSANGLGFAEVPGVLSNNIQSSIDQELGFIEVPLELEYKFSDKKLGVSVIGGFSTLILNHNEIYSSLQGERTLLGEATNISKTSFSANLGLGLKYKVSKQIDLNLEPVLKYQLNTFSDTSGNFNPYLIGVYTGFRFKF